MLEREAHRLEVREQSDEALLLGHAVLDDLIADQERLDTGFRNVRHKLYSTAVAPAVKGMRLSCGSRNRGKEE